MGGRYDAVAYISLLVDVKCKHSKPLLPLTVHNLMLHLKLSSHLG